MRKLLWALASILLLVPFCAAQQPAQPQESAQAGPVPARELTEEEKKALAEAEKQRKKFHDWITVFEIQSYTAAPQAFGYVGWCGGNLSWVFCLSSPIGVAGGERRYFRARLDSTGEEKYLVCDLGFTGGRWVLAPARYPARKGRLGLVYVLANMNGKLKKLTCGRPG